MRTYGGNNIVLTNDIQMKQIQSIDDERRNYNNYKDYNDYDDYNDATTTTMTTHTTFSNI